MPIIIDNFHVRIDAPIDNRFVVGGIDSFYQDKNDIEHKYLGLRIWDLNIPGGPFCWKGDIEGWVSENAIGVTVDGSTSPGYLPVFTSGPTVLGNSLLYQTSNQIGIGILPSSINPNTQVNGSAIDFVSNGLHVSGNIKTDNFLIGKGDYITQLNAGNVVGPGLLDIRYIDNRQSGGIGLSVVGGPYVLLNTGLSNGVNWVAANTLTVANANLASNISIVDDNISPSINYITFALGIGNQQLKINSSKMGFLPSTGQLFLSNGSAGAPVYSFLNSTSTGIYYDVYNINFSISGVNRVSISPGVITIYDSNYAQIDFYKSPTDVQKLFVGQGSILKYRTNSWDPNGAVQVASDNIVWHSGNLSTLKNSGNLNIETARDTNSQSFDANGNVIKGVYTYNYYGAPPVTTSVTPISNVFTNTIAGNIGTSQHVYFSVLSFGKGTEGSVQLASNWVGNNTPLDGNVVADREILIRSLRDTPNSVWSPWVKIWNSGNSGYVPFGAIMMWSGSTTQLPTGWRLCDGSSAVIIPAGSVPGQPSITSITIPDLRERFVVGAGDNPSISQRETYDSFYYYHWTNNATLTGIFAIGTGGSNPNLFTIDTTRLFYINSAGLGVQMTTSSLLNIGSLSIRPMIYTSSSLVAFFAFDMRINQYRLFKGNATNGVNYTTNYFTFNTTLTDGLGTWVEYKKYFEAGIRFNLTTRTGAETTNLSTILWINTEYGYLVGATGGSDNVRISESQLGPHRHTAQLRPEGGSGTWAGGGINADDGTGITNYTGGYQPIENRPPYYALAFIIYTGI